jgi:hydrogenase nickel incorporation protein HypA/HybF
MHEMALAEGILAVVLDAAGDQPVRKVDLRVGALQLVVPESLEFSFQLASEGTLAQNASINIEDVPARLRCKQCRSVTIVRQPPFQCDRCSSPNVEIVSGDEVLVDAVELENGETIRRRQVDADEILKEHMKEHHAAAS